MRISAKADYAVRAAIELAAAPDSKAVPAERIATSQGIPLNFLEHILSELRVAGVVRSQRGTDGGGDLLGQARGDLEHVERVDHALCAGNGHLSVPPFRVGATPCASAFSMSRSCSASSTVVASSTSMTGIPSFTA